jgi:small subunit ribosomal protein S9
MADSYYATGRRKSSSARVYLNNGSGNITINGRPLDVFFGRQTTRMIVRQPLDVVEMNDRFDVNVKVSVVVTPVRQVLFVMASRVH